MKILITGGTGFLGKSLVDSLQDLGDLFYTTRNLSNDPRAITADFKSASLNDDYDIIVHNAAFIPTPEYENNPTCYNVNYHGTKSFIAKNVTSSTKLIYIGSLAIYGGSSGNITLSSSPKPDSDYSRSKLSAEEVLPKNSYIIRPGTIYGPGMSSQRFITHAVNVIKNNENLEVYNPSTEFHLVHVNDITQLARTIILNSPNQKVYNLCTETLTKISLCNKIKEYFKSESKISEKLIPMRQNSKSKIFERTEHSRLLFDNTVGGIV